MEISGQWNIPLREPIQVHGALIIDSKSQGIYLVVFSSVSLGIYNEFNMITGITTSGTEVTLYKCNVYSETVNVGLNQKYKTIINVNYVFSGICFDSPEKILFHEAIFRFSNLDEWAYMKGFNLHAVDNCDFSLVYKMPEEIECALDDFSIRIYCGLESPLLLIVDKNVKVTQKVYISIKYQKPQTFENSLKIIKKIISFVSLNIERAVNLIELTVLNNGHYKVYGEKKIYHNIKVYSNEIHDKNYYAIDPRLCLLNLQTIKNDFQVYIENWFKKHETLQPIIDLYLNTINYKEMSIELYFLNLVQALESFHRRTRENCEIDPARHKSRVKEILNSAPIEYKGWLNQKLAFSNEPTLKNRLDELIHVDHDYWIFVDGKNEGDKLTNDVKNTRNYLTHYDQKLSKKALKGEELEYTCTYLQVMIEYYLLKEIGLSHEFLRNKVKERTRKVRDIKDILKYRRNN